MHDPSRFHNRPLTQALIPHGSVCGVRRECTMWPTDRCERVWDLWCLKLDSKRGRWLLCGGFPHANSNYNYSGDVSPEENVCDLCIKLLVVYRRIDGY